MIDVNKIDTNDIYAVLETYGVEAARAAIIREVSVDSRRPLTNGFRAHASIALIQIRSVRSLRNRCRLPALDHSSRLHGEWIMVRARFGHGLTHPDTSNLFHRLTRAVTSRSTVRVLPARVRPY